MTTAPFIPPRLNLVKNENSMPTGSQPFVVKLEGLYKIENGKLVGKLEELKRTQEIMPHQVCQVNESHFKINLLSQPMFTISGLNGGGTHWGRDYNSSYVSWLGGAEAMPTGIANGMTLSQSVFTVPPIGRNAAGAGNVSISYVPTNVVGNTVDNGEYGTIFFNTPEAQLRYRTITF